MGVPVLPVPPQPRDMADSLTKDTAGSRLRFLIGVAMLYLTVVGIWWVIFRSGSTPSENSTDKPPKAPDPIAPASKPRALSLTFDDVVKTIRTTKKPSGKVATGFLRLAQHKNWIESAASAIHKKFP